MRQIDVNSEENEQNSRSELDQALKLIWILLFFPVALAYIQALNLSTRSFVWRVKEFHSDILLSFVLLFPTSFLFLWTAIHRLFQNNIKAFCVNLMMYWVCLIPLSLATLSYRLTRIANDISEYIFPIKYLSATLFALQSYTFDKAERLFEQMKFVLPMFANNGRSIIGIDAHPKDFRVRKLRKRFPDRFVLESIKSGEFVTFNQDPKSPKSQLVIGGTGSGKTRLLSRMALASLAEEWRVVVIDFKGGSEEKVEFSSLPKFLPGKDLIVKNFPGEPIDMFRGSKVDVADRLISCLPAATGGDGDFYRQRAIQAINAVVVRTDADAPRNIEEVLRRIRNGDLIAKDQLDQEMFKHKEKGIPAGQILAENLASRFEPLRRTGEWATNGGFSWNDTWDLAVFSLDATREQEVRLGDLILMDFDMWLKSNERENQPKPILLICDEAGVLEKLPHGSVNLLNIVARGRSSRVGVVIASQTLASLGENSVGLNEQIGMKWIGRTSNPEELINMIGTRDVVEASYELTDQNWQLPKSGRLQRSYVVDPDSIRRLRTFYWNVSESGLSRFVYAPPLNPRL